MTTFSIHNGDITKTLISTDDLFSIFLNVYPNSVILNDSYSMIGLGKSIVSDLGYTDMDLYKKNLDVLAHGLPAMIHHRFVNGFLEEQNYHVCTKTGEMLLAGISGFYSGLLMDINGYIVLNFKNLEEMKFVYHKLESKALELDQFIYQSSHNLRGPVATIKGITRIIKHARNNEEIFYLTDQIGVVIDDLDSHLHKLSYLSESDKDILTPVGKIDFKYLERKLRETISRHSPDCDIYFEFLFKDVPPYTINECQLYSLLTNLFSFLLAQPKEMDSKIILDMFIAQSGVEIMLKINGFHVKEETRKILTEETYGYADLLKKPDMIYCYATHKIILKVKGGISFNFISSEDQVVIIYFPLVL